MGNTLIHCWTPASRAVRVYQDKGRILEYYYPVPASKLMGEYPNHLLVYRCSAKGSTKGAAKDGVEMHESKIGVSASTNRKVQVDIRVVRLGDTLELGHAYFLVNIPQQYLTRFAKYFKLRSPRESPRTPSSPCRHRHDRREHLPSAVASQIVAPLSRPALQSNSGQPRKSTTLQEMIDSSKSPNSNSPNSNSPNPESPNPNSSAKPQLQLQQLQYRSSRRGQSPRRVNLKSGRLRRGMSMRAPLLHKSTRISALDGDQSNNIAACGGVGVPHSTRSSSGHNRYGGGGGHGGKLTGSPSRGHAGVRCHKYSRRAWRPALPSILEVAD